MHFFITFATLLLLAILPASCGDHPDVYVDYVIVGLGAGGSMMANRASARPHIKVLALEEGIAHGCPACETSLGANSMPTSVWQNNRLPVAQQFAALLRSPTFSSWKGLGGSTILWGKVNTRSSRELLDQFYPPGYQYDDILARYKALENHFCYHLSPSVTNISAADCLAYHGKDGPFAISSQTFDALSEQILALADYARQTSNVSGSIGFSSDYNNPNTRKGVAFEMDFRNLTNKSDIHSPRVGENAFGTLLPPSLLQSRPNLVISTSSRALRLLYGPDVWEELSHGQRRMLPRRVIGVEYLVDGKHIRKAYASKRVIVCAGVLRTPHLLQLSGIGDPTLLASLNISMISNNSAVGAGLKSHQAVITSYQTKDPVVHNAAYSSYNALDIFFNTGLTPNFQADIQVEVLEGFYVNSVESTADSLPVEQVLDLEEGLTNYPYISMEIESILPDSVGFVQAVTNNPLDEPEFDYGWNFGNMLGTNDYAKLATAVATIRELMTGNNSFANKYVVKEMFPGEYFKDKVRTNLGITQEPALTQEADMLFIQYFMTNFFHVTSTCALGSCTDLKGQVLGVTGLVVCDNSILPRNPDGNPTTTLLAVCDIIADHTFSMDS